MIQVIMRLSQEKGVVDDVGSVNTTIRTQGVTEGPMYHPTSFAIPKVGTPHCLVPPMVNAVPKTYPPHFSPMPSERVYTYPYMPPLMVPSPPVAHAEVNHGAFLTNLYTLKIQMS